MGREAVMVGIGTNISVTLLYSLEYYNVHDNIFELPNKNVMLRKRGETLKLCIGNQNLEFHVSLDWYLVGSFTSHHKSLTVQQNILVNFNKKSTLEKDPNSGWTHKNVAHPPNEQLSSFEQVEAPGQL